MDVRNENNRCDPSPKSLEKFVLAISGKHVAKPPTILHLLEKMYLPEIPECTTDCSIPDKGTEKFNLDTTGNTGIMKEKLMQYSSKEEVISSFNNQGETMITSEEISRINTLTIKQWKCQEWYVQKAGIVSASKAKRVNDSQTRLESCANKDVSKLVNEIANSSVPSCICSLPDQPQDPRDWGLKHEATAQKDYRQVQGKQHHKLKLESRGFMISKDKPFLGASVDDLRHCECEKGCPIAVVEYKCPWKHRDITPKEAFLTPEVGGQQKDKHFTLKRNCRYYKLCLCDFVIWTKLGIFSVEIPFDKLFIWSVVERLQEFWVNHVLPFMMPQNGLQWKYFLYLLFYHIQGCRFSIYM
jgi:hypothetical protein